MPTYNPTFDPQEHYRSLLRMRLSILTEMEAAESLSVEDRSMLFGLIHTVAHHMKGRVLNDYSGRCMEGRSCVAVVCPDLAAFAFALAQACFDHGANPAEAQELLGEASQDNLGKQYVIYWPRLRTRS